MNLTKLLADAPDRAIDDTCDTACVYVAKIVLAYAAQLLRERGAQANTYDKQDQWEQAAKLLEGLE